MDLHEIAKRAAKLAVDNSSTILTAIGVTGVVTTAVLTGRATFKASVLILEKEEETDNCLRPKEMAELTWKLYVPAIGTGAVSIASIIYANRIGTRRAAAVAAAYTLSERAFAEYREKILEKVGEKKETEYRDELAQDRVRKNPPREVIIIEGNSVLCYDAYTGRYFTSNVETLKKAQNDINYAVLNSYYASLTDFYEKIGLPRTSSSDEFGWNSDKMLELKFSAVLTEEQKPCMSIEFAVAPIRDYNRLS